VFIRLIKINTESLDIRIAPTITNLFSLEAFQMNQKLQLKTFQNVTVRKNTSRPLTKKEKDMHSNWQENQILRTVKQNLPGKIERI